MIGRLLNRLLNRTPSPDYSVPWVLVGSPDIPRGALDVMHAQTADGTEHEVFVVWDDDSVRS